MSSYIVKDIELTSVANAIRTKGGTNASLTFPNGFVSAIGNISGGGGGSGDFSTAQVTSANDSEESITIPGTISEIGPGMTSVTDMSLRAGNSAEVVIYQGHQFVHLELDVTVVSGSATVVTVPDPMFGDMKFLDITGDCTIKVTV